MELMNNISNDLIENIIFKCDQVISLCDRLEHLKDKEEVNESEINGVLVKITEKLASAFLEIKQEVSVMDNPTDSKEESVTVQIEKTEDGYHFVLPCLLNVRNYNLVKSKKLARMIFEESFENYEEKIGFERISSNVEIMYINHFNNLKLLADNDNMDTKGFTDCINHFILIDDNPLLCDLLIRGLYDEAISSPYTEIYVTKKALE